MPFFGRKKEFGLLKDFYHDQRENLAVVCGRRRVGKSELLRASLGGGDLPFVFLQCRTTSIQSNVDDLMQLARTEFGLPELHLSDLEGALKAIFGFMEGRRSVLVLDEYPHLRGLLPGCDAVIAHLLDAYRDSGLKLVLCGSSLEVMKALTEERSPLKRKVGLNLHVEPMDYFDSALFYPDFSNEDKVRLYSVFGGMPFYNAKIDSSLSVRDNIIRLLAAPDAVLADEVGYLLMSEISKTSSAERVFEALAGGAVRFSEILEASQFSSSPALVDILKKLVGMELLRKVSPINDEHNKKRATYGFNDNLFHFHYRYVFRHQSRLKVWPAERVWDECMAEDFEFRYVPTVFEDIVKQFLLRENQAGRMEAPFFKIGSYGLDLPKERRRCEFGVVTEGAGGFAAYECDFQERPLTEAQVAEKIERVKASPLPAHRFGFVARAGFDHVLEGADRRFYDLDDLYRGRRVL